MISLEHWIGKRVITKKSFFTSDGIVEIVKGTICDVKGYKGELLGLMTVLSVNYPVVRFEFTVKPSDVMEVGKYQKNLKERIRNLMESKKEKDSEKEYL